MSMGSTRAAARHAADQALRTVPALAAERAGEEAIRAALTALILQVAAAAWLQGAAAARDEGGAR